MFFRTPPTPMQRGTRQSGRGRLRVGRSLWRRSRLWQLHTSRWPVSLLAVGLVIQTGCSKPEVRPLAILVSGDTAGWIVPCGCTSNQSGGLLRRGSYVKSVAASTPVVLADVGGAASGTAEYQRWKFQAILTGELGMGLDVHNIGAAETALGADELRKIAGELKVPLVSANLSDGKGQPLAPAYRIVDRSGRRVLVVGVLDPKLCPAELQASDPQEAILEALAEAKQQYDVALVLAYLPEDMLRALATALPEVDAVVGGPTGQTIEPTMVGPTLLTSATNKGKFLAHLDVPAGAKTPQLTAKIVEMAGELADEPQQKANLDQFYDRLAKRDFEADQTGFAPTMTAGLPAGYRVAGTAACQKCHSEDCQQWDDSPHGHAWQTLVDKKSHVDPDCQRCHTTGYGLPDGFLSIGKSAARMNVGCESCHGPSQAHVENTRVRTTFDAREQCVHCHDRENSPEFDYDEYWEPIEHGAAAVLEEGVPNNDEKS